MPHCIAPPSQKRRSTLGKTKLYFLQYINNQQDFVKNKNLLFLLFNLGYLKHGGLPRQTLLIYSGTPVLCPRPEIPQQAVKDSNLDASTQKIIENRTPRPFTVQVEVAQKRKVRSCCLNKYTLDASPVLVKLCRCQLPRAAFVEQDYPWSEYYSQFFEMQLWLALDAHTF